MKEDYSAVDKGKHHKEAGGKEDKGDSMEEDGSDFVYLIRQNSITYSYGASPVTRSSERRRNKNRGFAGRPRIPTTLRIATNAAALISCIFFSGIIFGWAPLKLILIRENQFSELCNHASNTNSTSTEMPQQQEMAAKQTLSVGDDGESTFQPCVQQLDKYNFIFTVAQFMLSFASLPVGFFLDHSYKTFHYAVAATLQISGLILFGISDSHSGRDYFVLSYTMLSLGGCMTLLGAFPASFLLPHHQAGILAAISCLFDFSSIIFTVFYRLNLYDEVIFSRRNLFAGLAALGALVYGVLIYGWLQLERRDWTAVVEEETKQNQRQQKEQDEVKATKDDSKRNANAMHTEYIRRMGIHDWSLQKQLCTFEYLLVVLFAAVQMLRCNFYIETVNELLQTYGDTNAIFAEIFSYVLPCGIIFIPMIDSTVRGMGVVGTLNVTNVIGIVFGVLLLIPSLIVQSIDFAVFACFRAFLYATLNTFIAFSFGVRTMGRVIGCTFTTAAVVTLLQYPAASFAENEQHTDFTTINLIMLGICIVPVGLSLGYSKFLAKKVASASVGETEPLTSTNVY